MCEIGVSLDTEITGVSSRPAHVVTPPVLSAVVVQTLHQVELYARRVREVLVAGLAAGKVGGFESEALPSDGLPGWFSGRESLVPAEVAGGREAFVSQRESDQFTIQDWLEMLDPAFRQWRWWDVTVGGPRIAIVWVDAGGEVVFNCEELYWLLYSCGARAAVGPLLLPSALWEAQDSIGFHDGG